MICALEFVPSGGLRREPLKYDMSVEEIEELRKQASAEEGGAAAEEDGEGAEEEFEDIEEGAEEDEEGLDKDGLPKSLRMDQYDEEDDGFAASVMAGGGMLRDAVDKHLGESDEEGSDVDDNVVESSDLVILGARTDEDSSILEVNCFDPANGNLWVHHDITLAAFPLSLAFLDTAPSLRADGGNTGAYVAVGTFKPAIEIWNLDVLDPLEPSATLGGEDLAAASALLKEAEEKNKHSKKDKKKKKKSGGSAKQAMAAVTLVEGSHSDAVMGLSWNRLQRQVLASASADTTVKLWDVSTQQCSLTLSHHADKVQSVCWHPSQPAVLASGSYDKSVCVLDVRLPTAVSVLAMPADIEDVAWDPWSPERVVGTCENGQVCCYDPRMPSTPLWTLQAHGKGQAVSKIAFAPHIRGLFATASTDKTVKLWDSLAADFTSPSSSASEGAAFTAEAATVGGEGGGGGGVSAPAANPPTCVGQREMGVGKLFSLGWCGDASNPWTLATAGSKATLALWETDESEAVKSRFGGGGGAVGSSRLSSQAQQAVSVGDEVGEVADAFAGLAGAAAAEEEEERGGMVDEQSASAVAAGRGGSGAVAVPAPTNAKKDKKKKKKAADKKPVAAK
eukprot:CAMPEP_0171905444 /NCGR_PEP_ID=MMETSP0993-20121228/5215_1 /TAXON_ID=483369 /ORGANISM="non described non described, Strain CCMP2098" /LENGTH=619 /DNA_ID=CAMNT_0012536925 /DNA_START=66 /DNA_END=1925 /DNA_ORIENTATION=+